jgi:arginase family enzyme
MTRPKGDLRNDLRCGFEIIKARDIDRYGVSGVTERLRSRVAGTQVYISVDIDVLDPAFAPGKHMFTTELVHMLRLVVWPGGDLRTVPP